MAIPTKITIAELDLGLDLLNQKVKEAKKLLSLEGFSSQVPKKLRQDFEEIEKSLDSLFKHKPGTNATTQELNKYVKDFEKLGSQLELTFSHISSSKIDISGLQEAIASLKELKQKTEEANQAYTQYKENLGSKGAFTGNELGELAAAGKAARASTGYRNDILNADKRAIAIAQSGGTKGEIAEAFAPLQEKLKNRITKIDGQDLDQIRIINDVLQNIEKRINSLAGQSQWMQGLKNQADQLEGELVGKTQESVNNIKQDMGESAEKIREASTATEDFTDRYRKMGEASKEADKVNKSLERISNRIQYLFSTTTIFMTIRRIVRGAVQDFKELDKQFNEIAIVSKYSTKEMWNSFASVNKMAQEYGVTTKDILEVQNLYYHQGKEMAEVNKLTAQTLTLAKITGMDYADATNKMTAALNAYKMSAEDASRVTDTVAALSANAATSSAELMTALTKTASIAANAGMSLENTEIFLTKMIETTREAPENLGTALKTIVARFGEVKNAIDENGEAIERADINKVDKALKSVGMTLLDSAGQVRDLDDVFMELSSKWDNLDRNTQRYIATMAAGSRQQSRFIAMMENYDRTMELVEVAQDSAGTGARQLAKAQESIETALNRLKSTWQELYSNVIKSGMIKGVLNLVNTALAALNKLPGPLGAVGLAFGAWGVKTLVVDKGLTSVIRLIKVLTGDMDAYAAAQEAVNKNSLFNKLKGGKQRLSEYRMAVLGLSGAEGSLAQIDKENVAIIMAKNNLGKESINQVIAENTGNIELAETQSEVVATKLADLAVSGQLNDQEAINTVLTKAQVDAKSKENLVSRISLVLGKQEIVQQDRKQAGLFKTIVAQKLANGSLKGFTKNGKEAIANVTKQVGANEIAELSFKELAAAIWAAVWPILAIGAAIGAVILIYNKFMKVTTDHSDAMDKARESADNYKESLKELKDLEEDYATYKDLNDKLLLTTEEQQQLAEATDALLEQYPDLLDYIDEHGNKVLKDNSAIEEAIKLKKEETQKLEENSLALKKNLAMQGLSTDSSAKKNAQLMAENIASAYSVDTSDTKKAAAKIIQKDGSFNYVKMGTEALNATTNPLSIDFLYKDILNYFQQKGAIEAILGGEGVNRDTIHGLMGKTFRMSEEDYQNFVKLAKDKNLEDIKDLTKIFSEIYGDNLGQTYAKAFQSKVGQLMPVVEADIKSQGDAIKQVLQQEIYDWLSMENYDFKPDSSGLNKLAKAFVDSFEGNEEEIKKNKKKIIQYMTNLDEEDYKKLQAGMNFGNLQLKNFLENGQISQSNLEDQAKIFAGDNALGQKALIAYWTDYLSLSKEDLTKINAVLNKAGDDIANLTFEQVKATQKKISSIVEKTKDENSAIRLYQEAYTTGKKYNSPDIMNLLNSSTVDTIEDIDNLVEKLQHFGVKTQDAYTIVKSLGGGLENLPLKDTAMMTEYLTKKFEDLDDSAESLTKLGEGKADLKDLQKALNLLTKDLHGADFTSTLNNLLSGLKVSSNGFKLSAQEIANAKKILLDSGATIGDVEKALLQQSIANTQAELDLELKKVKIKGYSTEALLKMTDSQLTALAAEYTAYASFIQNIITIRSELEGLQMNLELIDIAATYSKQTLQNAGKDAVDAAEKAKKAWENFVKFLRDFDEYSNLDKIRENFEEKLGHLEYEIKFTTNSKLIEKDVKKQINLINNQIAANRGGQQAAQESLQMWRNVIQQRNSGYVTFDADGNALVNAQKLKTLQEQIRDANEHDAEVLQQQYDEIMANVEAYDKIRKKHEEYSKDLESSFDKLQSIFDDVYNGIVKLENKIIEVIQAREDKELQAVKDKYSAIQEENDKYLSSVRKMVDKEREIRDRQNTEDEIEAKERRLAMLRMSGGSKKEIRALEKEITQDRQDLSDANVDRMIEDLEERFNTQAEEQNKETTYLENALNERREKRAYYIEEAKKMMEQGSDEVIAYLMANDKEYLTASEAGKELWKSSTEKLVNQGIASYGLLVTNGLTPTSDALTVARENAESFDMAVQQYAETAVTKNGEVQSSVASLTNYYKELVKGVTGQDGLISALDKLAQKYRDVANAQKGLGVDQTEIGTGVVKPGASSSVQSNFTTATSYGNFTKDLGIIGSSKKYRYTGKSYQENGSTYYQFEYTNDKGQKDDNVWILDSYVGSNLKIDDNPPFGAVFRKRDIKHKGGGGSIKAMKYASGGMVDFTGPAWVDGTKTRPEAFLSASDTANIAALRDTLSYIYSQPTISNAQPISSSSNATYNITIQVDSISNDYDVDQAINRIEEKISKASKYRNINILKNSK